MTITQSAEPVTYERLARVAGRPGRWRPIIGTFVLLGLYVVGVVLVFGQFELMGAVLDLPKDADGARVFNDLTETALALASIAIGLPALALTMWWFQRRTWGSVTSVTGRLRLSWLGRCFVVAGLVFGLTMAAAAGIPEADATTDGSWVGWAPFAVGLVMLVCLVPLQAAAEEFIFRGWLLQAAGSLFRRPVLILVPQALLFAAGHGWGTVWGFVDLTVFGVVMGWLTLRTGGIEAAIASHVTNNLVMFVMSSAYTGGLAVDETAADMPWQYAVVDMACIVLFGVLILRLAKRYEVKTAARSSWG